ncbi:MAG TPA: PE domain-containing protein, partial [Actinophytocola sp.]|uniref:PE domain-containing protein n=1 Tax=Actinophytocola sp. TaxID=1872138 RepID=UPI002DB823A9
DLLGPIGRGLTQAFADLDTYNSALTSGTFTVTKDNVLAAAKIIKTQADALDTRLRDSVRELRVSPPGDDDVSTRVAPAWNDLLVDNPDSYAQRIAQYIQALHTLAEQCADSARAYGHTEQDIAAVFGAQSA